MAMLVRQPYVNPEKMVASLGQKPLLSAGSGVRSLTRATLMHMFYREKHEV